MTLRVIGAVDAQEDLSKAERIERIMRECMAANPSTVLVIWECDALLEMRCEPSYPAVAIGMLELGRRQVEQ